MNIDRFLIVGYGSIGKRHLRILREILPHADIRVLRHQPCSDTPELSNGCFDNLTHACAFSPQAAVIATPAPFHLETALALAAAGCNLLVEKPLSHTASCIEPLLLRVRMGNLILQVGYNLRFLPSLTKFRDRIRNGDIGRILSVHCEIGQFLPYWRPDSDYRQGVSAKRELGGGVLLEMSHEIDYLRWIFGEVKWVNAWLSQQSELEIDVEDTAYLTLGFLSDTEDHAVVASLCLDFIRHDSMRLCTAVGESGSLRWNGLTGEVEEYLAGSNGWQQIFHHPHHRNESYHSQLQHFIYCIQTGATPLVTGEDGLAVLDIIKAMRTSAVAQGARIDVEHENLVGQEVTNQLMSGLHKAPDLLLGENRVPVTRTIARNDLVDDIDAVGFIFARGGSKGLPGKNIRPLAGKPLIVLAIEHAKAVKRLRRIIVSTDSEAIANLARAHGAEVPFLRPTELARDDSPEWLAWRHALTYLLDTEGKLPNAMVSIPTTAPLRLPVDIENCLDEFALGDADIVITVTEAHRNPWFNMVKTQANGTVQLLIPPSQGIANRQVAPPVYDIATVAYVADPAFVFSHPFIFGGRVRAVLVPKERAIDIDTLLDFETAEFLMKRRI